MSHHKDSLKGGMHRQSMTNNSLDTDKKTFLLGEQTVASSSFYARLSEDEHDQDTYFIIFNKILSVIGVHKDTPLLYRLVWFFIAGFSTPYYLYMNLVEACEDCNFLEAVTLTVVNIAPFLLMFPLINVMRNDFEEKTLQPFHHLLLSNSTVHLWFTKVIIFGFFLISLFTLLYLMWMFWDLIPGLLVLEYNIVFYILALTITGR